jgi:thiol-disulfide isomerase/thioredoxin
MRGLARKAVTCLALAALAPSAPASGAEPGAAAPNCSLRSLADGGPRELADLRGQVVWIDFWATWCGRCLEVFEFLDSLEREWGDAGLVVIGVNVDENPADARALLAKHPVSFAQTQGSGECPRAFGVEGMPAGYLVDRKGVIRYVHLGFRPGEARKLRERVAALLAEEPK